MEHNVISGLLLTPVVYLDGGRWNVKLSEILNAMIECSKIFILNKLIVCPYIILLEMHL